MIFPQKLLPMCHHDRIFNTDKFHYNTSVEPSGFAANGKNIHTSRRLSSCTPIFGPINNICSESTTITFYNCRERGRGRVKMALSRGGCEMAEPLNLILKVRDSVKSCGVSLLRAVRSFGDLKRVIVIYALCMGVGYMMWMSLLVLDMVAGSCLSDAVAGLIEEPNQFQFLFVSIQFTNGMLGLLLGFSLLTHPPAQAFFLSLTRYCLRRWKIRGLPKVKYASLNKTDQNRASCCICLGTIGDEESVRILPNCKHYFHRRCVDRWLLCGNNCPICRATVCDDS